MANIPNGVSEADFDNHFGEYPPENWCEHCNDTHDLNDICSVCGVCIEEVDVEEGVCCSCYNEHIVTFLLYAV